MSATTLSGRPGASAAARGRPAEHHRQIERALERGPFPRDDGWGWLYRAFEAIAPEGGRLRHAVCRYFLPGPPERWHGGLVYRILGVPIFGAVIPTGGILVRRITGARMQPYTLRGPSPGAARDFYYRTCVFELLHLPFLLAVAGIAVHRALMGRPDLAIEDTIINLVANVYPVMHHRRTRLRIVRLLERRKGGPTGLAAPPATGTAAG